MDMEHELQALRAQLAEKSKHSLQLQKEVLDSLCKPLSFLLYMLKTQVHALHKSGFARIVGYNKCSVRWR